MAQDVRHSGSQLPGPQNSWDEKEVNASELTAAQLALPRSNTRSASRGRNPTPDPSGSASRSQEDSAIDDAGRYQDLKPKIRTLPGMH